MPCHARSVVREHDRNNGFAAIVHCTPLGRTHSGQGRAATKDEGEGQRLEPLNEKGKERKEKMRDDDSSTSIWLVRSLVGYMISHEEFLSFSLSLIFDFPSSSHSTSFYLILSHSI